jgi:hypothetical protein
MKTSYTIVKRAYTKNGALVSVKWIKGRIWLCYAKGGRRLLTEEYYSLDDAVTVKLAMIAGVSGLGLRLA